MPSPTSHKRKVREEKKVKQIKAIYITIQKQMIEKGKC